MRRTMICQVLAVTFLTGLYSMGQTPPEDVERIIGRAVDDHGRPVANAEIVFHLNHAASTLQPATAGEDGRFALKVGAISDESIIWVTSRLDWDNWRVLLQPGINLVSEYLTSGPYISLKGVRPRKTIDLGDVRVQAYYAPVRIVVSKEWKDRVFHSNDAISFKVFDASGAVADDSKGGRGINEIDSSITIALPIGRWRVEMKSGNMPWKVVAKKLIISSQQPITIKFPDPP